MKLPDGVTYNEGVFSRLISDNGEAVITIAQKAIGSGTGAPYDIKDRDFEENFKTLFSDDYREFDRRYHLVGDRKDDLPIYSGAEHGKKGAIPNRKLPNITVVPNVRTSHTRVVALRFERKDGKGNLSNDDFQIPTGQEVTLFGCTMGHWNGEAGCPDGVQEIYEFQSYGVLVIDLPGSGEVEMWVARDGDKVVVPQQCHMTLYNLDDTEHPLVTLDFANPERNDSNKKLVEHSGPVLMGYYMAHEAVFALESRYINRTRIHCSDAAPSGSDYRECLNGGVRLFEPVGGREVRIPLGTRSGLGRQLYEALTRDIETIARFIRLGIRVRRASPEARVGEIWYGRPLVECAQCKRSLYHYFMGSKPLGNPESIPKARRLLHEGERAWSSSGPRKLEPGRKNGERAQLAIPILIEGAGDWVDKAFIPAMEPFLGDEKNPPRITVIIADDSRWHAPGAQLSRTIDYSPYRNIQRAIDNGKVFVLNKADTRDLKRYQGLLPGVVFIVTPDYTHSALSRQHLDRAPTIFVEKPFDANSENVRELLEARGLAALDTEIYSLDHYRFYAWRLKEPAKPGQTTLLAEATEWLGGALQEARFCMVESRPMEPRRVRALQFGLMLDMLPHCFALLAFFGKLDTVDELRLLDVRRYIGAPIASETYAHVAFTFEDYSDNGWRVPCKAWIGKGLAKDRKFFEVSGVNGNSLLVVFGDKTNWRHPKTGDQEVVGGIYFVTADGVLKTKAKRDGDSVYKQLFADLVGGTRNAIVCAMPLRAGERIIRSLDRIWNAIQSHSPWRPYEVGLFDCFSN